MLSDSSKLHQLMDDHSNLKMHHEKEIGWLRSAVITLQDQVRHLDDDRIALSKRTKVLENDIVKLRSITSELFQWVYTRIGNNRDNLKELGKAVGIKPKKPHKLSVNRYLSSEEIDKIPEHLRPWPVTW